MKSHFVDVSGPTHYVEEGTAGSTLVLVHGIGASYLSWQPVMAALAERHRVLAIDLIGFGFTPPHGRKATVQRNARLVTDFIETATLDPVTLVGNSMGGLIALLATLAEPELVERLILVNPALPIVSLRSVKRESQRLALPLLPVLGPLAARYYYHGRSPEQEVEETLRLVLSSTDQVDPFYRAASVEMSRARREMEWAIPCFTEAARSIAPLLASQRRFRRILHQITVPTLLIHGDHDAVVPPESARWAAAERPDWDFVMLREMGHTPQVQDAGRFIATVEDWLAQPVLV